MAISSYDVYKWVSESRARKDSGESFEFTKIYNDSSTIHWRGQEISFSDTLKLADVDTRGDAYGSLHIMINNHDHSVENHIRIRPSNEGMTRYHGSAKMAVIKDLNSGIESFGIIHYLKGDTDRASSPDMRLLLIDEKGKVVEDIFQHSDRAGPPYRYMFMRLATMDSSGFRYNVYSYGVSIYYPYVYPWGTGVLGFVLFGIAIMRISWHRFSQNTL